MSIDNGQLLFRYPLLPVLNEDTQQVFIYLGPDGYFQLFAGLMGEKEPPIYR